VGREIAWRGQRVDEVGPIAKSGAPLVHVDPDYFRPTEVDICWRSQQGPPGPWLETPGVFDALVAENGRQRSQAVGEKVVGIAGAELMVGVILIEEIRFA